MQEKSKFFAILLCRSRGSLCGMFSGLAPRTKQMIGKHRGNLNKKHFWRAGSCVVCHSVFSRSSVGKIGEGKEKIKRKPILRKVLFQEKAPEYHSGAINKEKHLQGRCCGRRTQKCLGSRNMLKHANEESGLRKDFVLCIALTPQSGDSSDAILEVPSEALLHPHA